MKKKITIITGGSSGLGFELSKLFSQVSNICIVARDTNKLDLAAKAISVNTKFEVITFCADVSKESQVKSLYESLSDYEIERVINCAGAGKFGKPEDITSEMVDELIDSNLKSVIFMSSNAIKVMNTTGGTIATVLSTAALRGNKNESVYCAVKWGAKGFCEALKTTYKGSNIKIITICPGGINTPFWKPDCGASPDVKKFMNPKELAETIYSTLLNRNTLFCQEIVIEKL